MAKAPGSTAPDGSLYITQVDGSGNLITPGTVTSVSVVSANGVSGSVATSTTTPAITITLGAITPTSVNGLTITTSTGTFTVGALKTFTVSNSLTFTGTDASSVAFGAGGTIGAVGYSATGQIAATATNDNAAAGTVGEFVSASIAFGSAVSLVSATTKTITSISLTAGDWDVTGMVGFNGAATTLVTAFDAGVSLVNNTLPGTTDHIFWGFASGTAAFAQYPSSFTVPRLRVSVSVTTTVYLVADATFTVSTCTAFGKIEARRIR